MTDIVEKLTKIAEDGFDVFPETACEIVAAAAAEITRLRSLTEWRTIDDTVKRIEAENEYAEGKFHKYGPWIIGYPGQDHAPARMRWWEAGGANNFIGDDGNAYRPTHWLPLPLPPEDKP